MTAAPLHWPNVVIRASAGTGKTYQLSNRYLQLAADGQPPEQVLASTFARKAAGEILGRVLVRLAEAALDESARRELVRAIDRDLSPADCHRLLKKLVGELHRLRIGTLDSFFVQLAGNFTLELGLPGGWQILDELDDQQLRLEAIRQVLAGGSTAELTALLNLLFKGEAVRSVTQQIADIVEQLYGVFCDSDRAAWHALARPAMLPPEQLEQAIEQLAAAPQPAEGRVAKAWNDDLARARNKIGSGFSELAWPKRWRAKGCTIASRSTRRWRRCTSHCCGTRGAASWLSSSTAPRRRINCSPLMGRSISGSNWRDAACGSTTCPDCWPRVWPTG